MTMNIEGAADADPFFSDPNPSGSPPVLLLHELGANCSSWSLQIPPLVEAGFRPIAPDVRGFGKSPYHGGGMAIPSLASDAATLLQSLNASPAIIVGISMGGAIALQLALDEPQAVSKLVLVNTFASLRAEKLSIWLYFSFRLLLVHTLGLPAQARTVARRIFPKPEQAELRQLLIEQITQADPRAYRAVMRALARFDVTARLGNIRVPTLIITGEQDTTVPLKSQRVLLAGIPNAWQIIMPAAGHAVTAEQPQAFNQHLLDFLTFLPSFR